MENDFRVRFETKDGILLKNRKADSKWYYRFGRPDQEMIDSVLKTESREIGVRVISYTLEENGRLRTRSWSQSRTSESGGLKMTFTCLHIPTSHRLQ